MDTSIQQYNNEQKGMYKEICELLATLFDAHLLKAESKVWHRHPVWFLEGNPIVGYSVLKDCVQLLFWSGQSFEEPELKPEGTFKAAEARFATLDDVKKAEILAWLKKAEAIQWDYKNIVKRRGVLERIK